MKVCSLRVQDSILRLKLRSNQICLPAETTVLLNFLKLTIIWIRSNSIDLKDVCFGTASLHFWIRAIPKILQNTISGNLIKK